MWMQLRFHSLDAFLHAARAIGFHYVELSHIVTPATLASLTIPEPAVRVLHHPCPNPGGVPELSDTDEARRRVAITHGIESIRWAARLGATVVVLHLGTVAFDRRWENALRARWLQASPEPIILETADSLRQQRALSAGVHLDAARRSLETLLPVAESEGVRLGLENGEWVASLPDDEEATLLLEEFESPALSLWIDTGHATILERLGFTSLREWLELSPARISGLHYHDVSGLRDHLVPGNGTIDWSTLAPAIPRHAMPTCEVDWYYSAAEVRRGVSVLAEHGLVGWTGSGPDSPG